MSIVASATLDAAARSPVILGADVSIATAAHGNAEITRHCLDALFKSAAGSYELKYGLPTPLEYPGIDKVPWAQLASRPFEKGRHFSGAGDYSSYAI